MIDLRSDTVTRPTAQMRAAMAAAEVGDDVYGEDPTVNLLERRAAEIFDREAALFVPTGTMGNQIAIRLHTQPGQEVIAESRAHILDWEMATTAVFSGCLVRAVPTERGILTWKHIEPAIHERGALRAATGLIEIENTHNMAGGVVTPLPVLEGIWAGAKERKLPSHLDGARIFNAATALGVDVRELTRGFDTVMFCLSKGLGAPVGSVLLGSAATIVRAQRARKLFGGGMRQAGIIAAGGLYALRHNVERLADDHRRARALGERLGRVPGLSVDQRKLQTNMVFADTHGVGLPAADVVRLLDAEGVLALDEASWSVRFVTHLDLDDAAVEEAGEIVARVVERVRV